MECRRSAPRAKQAPTEGKFYLGPLCKRGHDHEGSGKSLRRVIRNGPQAGKTGNCVECTRIHSRQKRQEDPVFREKEKKRLREYNHKKTAEDPESVRKGQARRRANRKRKRQQDPEYDKRCRESHRKAQEKRRDLGLLAHWAREAYKDEERRTRILVHGQLRRVLQRAGVTKSQTLAQYGIEPQAIYKVLGPRPSKDHHLEHIRPCADFDLSDPEQVRECWSPENLRWLHKDLNLRKNSKLEEDFLKDVRNDVHLRTLWEVDVGPLG